MPRVYGDGCHLNLLDTETRDCVYGDPWSTTSIVLFGDSHAAQWFPALDRAGKRQGWKLVSWTKSSCPAAMVDMFNPQLGRIYEECSRWRKATIERIVALHPALVVLSNFGGYVGRGREAGEWHVTTEQWTAGVESTLRWITAGGTPALIVMDSPAPGFDVPSCLSQMAWHSWGAQRGCDFSVLENSRPIVRRVDVDVAARVPQVSTLDPKELICSGDHCPAERDGFVLYRDTHHLSVRFAASLSDVMERSITELLYRKAHPGSAVRLVQ